MQEYQDPQFSHTVVLLNAFGRDVYFALQFVDQSVMKGYKNIHQLLDELTKKNIDQPIRFLGNGTELYRSDIESAFDSQVYIPDPLPHTTSVEQIGIMGLGVWQEKKNGVHQLMPLYLKQYAL